jgi:hypothetical protein
MYLISFSSNQILDIHFMSLGDTLQSRLYMHFLLNKLFNDAVHLRKLCSNERQSVM